MNLYMFSHEFLAILVVCTLGGWLAGALFLRGPGFNTEEA